MNTSQVSVNVCLKKDGFFNHNIEDSHPTLSKWFHIDVSVLHFFLSNTFFSRECLLIIFHQWL